MAVRYQQWLRCSNNKSTTSAMVVQCQQWLCSVNNGCAVSTMVVQSQQWLCSVNNGCAVSTMVVQCQQWLHLVSNNCPVLTITVWYQQWRCGAKDDCAMHDGNLREIYHHLQGWIEVQIRTGLKFPWFYAYFLLEVCRNLPHMGYTLTSCNHSFLNIVQARLKLDAPRSLSSPKPLDSTNSDMILKTFTFNKSELANDSKQ
jgi:hypothetical protein